MSFVIENWYLFVIAAVSGGMLLWPVITGSSSQGLSVMEAVQLINRERAVVIDVCEPDEYAAGHVSGARNVPLAALESADAAKDAKKDGKRDAKKDSLKGLPTNKSLPVILVCASGARAAKALALIKALGHDNAQVLGGGMAAWREASMPIEKSA